MTAFMSDDADFRQFASFDRPLQPPATLVDAIRNSTSNGRAGSLVVIEPMATPTTMGSAVAPPRRMLPSRRHSPLQVAAAVLLVVTLFGSLFALNWPNGSDNRDNLAFQPSAELPNEVNSAGNAGGSWVVSETNPEMTFAVELGSVTGELVGFDPTRIRGIIVGDSVVFPTFANSRGFLHRSDLGGTSLVWTVPMQALSNIVSDGTLVYLEATEGVAGTSLKMLTAISLESGAVAWQVASFDSAFETSSSLVIAGGTLYVANTAGEIMAVSASDGTMLWNVALATPENPDPDMLTRTSAAPFMALGDAGLFVVRSDQVVVRLDPTTGDETGTIDVPGMVGSSEIMTIPQVRGNTLALLVAHLDAGEGNATPITVVTADAGTLTIEHQVEFPDLRGGNMVLTDDAVYVPFADSPASPAHIAKIDLATGEVTAPFGDVSSRALLFPSASGNILMVAMGDSRTLWFLDRHTGELLTLVETGVHGADGAYFSMPMQIWNGKPITIDSLGVAHVVVDDPRSIPSSTPIVVAHSW